MLAPSIVKRHREDVVTEVVLGLGPGPLPETKPPQRRDRDHDRKRDRGKPHGHRHGHVYGHSYLWDGGGVGEGVIGEEAITDAGIGSSVYPVRCGVVMAKLKWPVRKSVTQLESCRLLEDGTEGDRKGGFTSASADNGNALTVRKQWNQSNLLFGIRSR